MKEMLDLANIRKTLIRLEETIIFYMIERAQFLRNENSYLPKKIQINDYENSFFDYLLNETEKVYAKAGRYTAPDEFPFTDNLPDPIIKNRKYEFPIKGKIVNMNPQILKLYFDKILPQITATGDDSNYGSSVVNDIQILQAISRRIHYGQFVAESKFIKASQVFTPLIESDDKNGIIDALTYKEVEMQILDRIELKAGRYGQDPFTDQKDYKIKPSLIRDIYEHDIIPLTKEVEYLYLKERL